MLLKRLLYDTQVRVIAWLTHHYPTPRDVEEFLRWYPAMRRSRAEVHRLLRRHFGEVPIVESVRHDFYAPWLMELEIKAAYPPEMAFEEAMQRDEAFIEDWCSSPLYRHKVNVFIGW